MLQSFQAAGSFNVQSAPVVPAQPFNAQSAVQNFYASRGIAIDAEMYRGPSFNT